MPGRNQQAKQTGVRVRVIMVIITENSHMSNPKGLPRIGSADRNFPTPPIICVRLRNKLIHKLVEKIGSPSSLLG
jgi:hypothetical protein